MGTIPNLQKQKYYARKQFLQKKKQRNRPILQKQKQYARKQTISSETNNYAENNTMQKSNRYANTDQITFNCLIKRLPNVDTPAENQVLH